MTLFFQMVVPFTIAAVALWGMVKRVDVYDALVTERCYKKPFTTEEAFQMITGGKCGTFSPKLMEAFTRARADFEELARSRE